MPPVLPASDVACQRQGNLSQLLAEMEGELVSRTFAIPTQYEDHRFIRAAEAAVNEISAEEREIPSDMETCARYYERESLPLTFWRKNQRTEYFVSLREYRYLDLDYRRAQRKWKGAEVRFNVAACVAALGWMTCLIILIRHLLAGWR